MVEKFNIGWMTWEWPTMEKALAKALDLNKQYKQPYRVYKAQPFGYWTIERIVR